MGTTDDCFYQRMFMMKVGHIYSLIMLVKGFGSGSWIITGLLFKSTQSTIGRWSRHHIQCNQTREWEPFQIEVSVVTTLAEASCCYKYHTSVERAAPGLSSPPSDAAVSPSPAAPSPPASMPPASSLSPRLAPSSSPPLGPPAEPPSLSVVSASQPPAGPCSPAPSVAISIN